MLNVTGLAPPGSGDTLNESLVSWTYGPGTGMALGVFLSRDLAAKPDNRSDAHIARLTLARILQAMVVDRSLSPNR